MISLIRYPGSKAKLVHQILRRFPAHLRSPLWKTPAAFEYREPFFGAGSVGLAMMQEISTHTRVWLNDIDPGMVALWQAVQTKPLELMKRCGDFIPTVDAFYLFKAEDGKELPLVEMAFRKLALHRLSFSGIGFMAGGPIGGREQSSNYNVDCRWNLQQIRRNISRINKVMNRFPSLKITCGDFLPMIETAGDSTFIYLDPPYYEKGEQLYKFNMDDAAHVRMSESLLSTTATWMLSYDDHPRVRALYAGCIVEPIYATYTGAVKNGGTRPKNQEVLIFRDPASIEPAASSFSHIGSVYYACPTLPARNDYPTEEK